MKISLFSNVSMLEYSTSSKSLLTRIEFDVGYALVRRVS
jgi:hypothetical protein